MAKKETTKKVTPKAKKVVTESKEVENTEVMEVITLEEEPKQVEEVKELVEEVANEVIENPTEEKVVEKEVEVEKVENKQETKPIYRSFGFVWNGQIFD